MKIRLNIKDSKAASLIELLKNLDFVDIENEEDFDEIALSKEEKGILDQRLQTYKVKPHIAGDWQDLKEKLTI